MSDLEVDVDGLESLVTTVDAVRKGLENTPKLVSNHRDEVGSSDVSNALDHFQSHWHDGRRHIADNAKTMTGMLSEAVKQFRKVDASLAHSVSNTTSTSHIGHAGT